MTIAEMRQRWQQRRDVFATFGASVDGAKLVAELLLDLESLERTLVAESVTLTEAHAIGGYSVDHLQRLVSRGQLENVGRRGKPRIRRADVPTKPGRGLRLDANSPQIDPRRRIVASVLNGETP